MLGPCKCSLVEQQPFINFIHKFVIIVQNTKIAKFNKECKKIRWAYLQWWSISQRRQSGKDQKGQQPVLSPAHPPAWSHFCNYWTLPAPQHSSFYALTFLLLHLHPVNPKESELRIKCWWKNTLIHIFLIRKMSFTGPQCLT